MPDDLFAYNMAVRASRKSPSASLDFLPTPPWGVRAFIEQRIGREALADAVVLEPAAGAGDMARTLREYAPRVLMADIADYGVRGLDGQGVTLGSFLDYVPPEPVDWIFTNPPFNQGPAFIAHARAIARRGVAMVVRTAFVEGQDRYRTMFGPTPPDEVAVYSERLPLVVGRTDPDISSSTSYSWITWRADGDGDTRLRWIVPCRKEHERADDYHFLRWYPGQSDPGTGILALTAQMDALPERIARALAILRPTRTAYVLHGAHRSAALLIEPGDDGDRVLARIYIRYGGELPNLARAAFVGALRAAGLAAIQERSVGARSLDTRADRATLTSA